MKKGKKTPKEVKAAGKTLLENPDKFKKAFYIILKKSDKKFR